MDMRIHKGRMLRVGAALSLLLFLGIGSMAAIYSDKVQMLTKRILMGTMVNTKLHTKDTIFEHAAIATDNEQCSKIGKEILTKKGSAVDAAIAAMLCLGVINAHSTGIGGGGFMLVYQKKKGEAKVIDFRESAPANANKDMFHGDPKKGIRGGLAVAVPGELRGMQKAHKRYGMLKWRDLFQPAIELAEKGFPLSESCSIAVNKWKKDVLGEKCLRKIYAKKDGTVKQKGDLIRNKALAKTLRTIAEAGNADPFYTGEMAKTFAREVAAQGGVVTAADLEEYKAKLRNALNSSLGDMTMLNVPPPASGPVLAFILNVLKGYNMKQKEYADNTPLALHRIIEAFQFAYARRTELADPDFEPSVKGVMRDLMDEKYADECRDKIEDDTTLPIKDYGGKYNVPLTTGTTHLVVVSPEGDAVAVTSTVNGYLGAKFRSCELGFIYNNEMDDFSAPNMSNEFGLPPSEVNYIKPHKRPQSSSVPVIILDQNQNVRMAAGGSGGSIITTAVAQVIMNHIWFGMNLKDAVQQPRVHAQLVPDVVFAETRMPEKFVKKLKQFKHKVNVSDESHAVVQAIARIDKGWQQICQKKDRIDNWDTFCKKGKIHHVGIFAESDYRKGGVPDGF